MKEKFYNYIQDLQDTITRRLEEVDGKAKFREDLWDREEGGGDPVRRQRVQQQPPLRRQPQPPARG